VRRRDFVALAGTLLAWPSAARAQPKVHVVGLLWNDSVKPSPYIATLVAALRERGYVTGRNLRIEDRVVLEGYTPMAENAAALVRAKADVIVTYGITATTAAAKATREIPIVAITGADPVARGLAASLSRPGGNVTGVSTLSSGLTRKRVELLKQLVPRLSRIGLLIAPGNIASTFTISETDAAAKALKLQVHVANVNTPEEIEGAVASLAKAKVGAMYVSAATFLAAHSERLVAAVAKHRIPAMYGVERYIAPGGLMVYSPSVRKAFVRIAGYVDRVLKGARPSEMPIEQTDDIELVINLKTARALGIVIPQAILQRADRAIE
jgi:putative ABC transport system substrate-binding protein